MLQRHGSSEPNRESKNKSGVQFEVDRISESSEIEATPVFDEESFKRKIKLPLKGSNSKVDEEQLRKAIIRGSKELEKNITRGDIPVFGYPTVWYGNQEEFRSSDGLQRFLFNSVIKKSING